MEIDYQASSIKHQASSIKHQASSIKHQASSIKHQAIILIVIVDILFMLLGQSLSDVGFGSAFFSFPILVLSCLIFYLFLGFDIKINNGVIRKVIMFISNNTLPIYLLSVIGDNMWYPIFIEKWNDFSSLLIRFPFIVVLLFTQAIITSYVYVSFIRLMKTVITKSFKLKVSLDN